MQTVRDRIHITVGNVVAVIENRKYRRTVVDLALYALYAFIKPYTLLCGDSIVMIGQDACAASHV